MTDEKKASEFPYPLPRYVTLGGSQEQKDRYWVTFDAQQKFFTTNGCDDSPAQVLRFWAQYKPEDEH